MQQRGAVELRFVNTADAFLPGDPMSSVEVVLQGEFCLACLAHKLLRFEVNRGAYRGRQKTAPDVGPTRASLDRPPPVCAHRSHRPALRESVDPLPDHLAATSTAVPQRAASCRKLRASLTTRKIHVGCSRTCCCLQLGDEDCERGANESVFSLKSELRSQPSHRAIR